MTQATRTIVMTGATRGIGRFAAIDMLRDAPDLHLALIVRSSNDQAFLDGIASASGNPNVSAVTADLASLASIRAATAELVSRLNGGHLPPLHGFVGNAGLQFQNATQVTPDGFEQTFAVNVLANHLLVHGLADHFVPPARIVLTTSDTHFGDFAHTGGMVPAPSWSDAERLSQPGAFEHPESQTAGGTAYSTSKLGVIYLVHELARRLPPGVTVYSFNPGLVPGTGLARDRGPLARFAWRAVMPVVARTPIASRPAVAGANLAAAAIGPTPGENGSYINRRRAERSSNESYDRAREADLWHTADRLSGIRSLADEPIPSPVGVAAESRRSSQGSSAGDGAPENHPGVREDAVADLPPVVKSVSSRSSVWSPVRVWLLRSAGSRSPRSSS